MCSCLEFLKFVKHQEECRHKWARSEQENVSMKQTMAKLKVCLFKDGDFEFVKNCFIIVKVNKLSQVSMV